MATAAKNNNAKEALRQRLAAKAPPTGGVHVRVDTSFVDGVTDKDSPRIWKANAEALQAILEELGYAGEFIYRPQRKAKWRVDVSNQTGLHVFGLAPNGRPGVRLSVKTRASRGSAGNIAWEGSLTPPSGVDLEEFAATLKTRDYPAKGRPRDDDEPAEKEEEAVAGDDAVREEVPEVEQQPLASLLSAQQGAGASPTTAALPDVGSILAGFSKLQDAAQREEKRRQRVKDLEAMKKNVIEKVEELKNKIVEFKAKEAKLDDDIMQVLAESEADMESAQAVSTLQMLQQMLSAKPS